MVDILIALLIALLILAVFIIIGIGVVGWLVSVWKDDDAKRKHRDATTRAAEKYLSETDGKSTD